METNKTEQQPAIIVLGATGKTGSQALRFLSEKGIRAKAFTRDMSKSIKLDGVEWVQGDMNKENDLRNVLKGGKKLYLNTGIMQDMVALQCHIIDLAREEGIEYIIKLSTPSARQDSKEPVGGWHWQIEEYLKTSGLAWNILQPQSFMQNWLATLADSVRAERKIYEASGEGRRPFIDTRDIGEVAATLFDDPGSFLNSTIQLSGPQAVSYYDVASAIGRAIGLEVTYIDQTPEEARQRYVKKGAPEWAINTYLAIAANQKSGAAEKMVTDKVSKILSKPARSIDDFAAAYAEVFR